MSEFFDIVRELTVDSRLLEALDKAQWPNRYEPAPKNLYEGFLWWLWKGSSYKERATKKGRKQGRGNFSWCPNCGNDLVGDPMTICSDTDLVRYICGACNNQSEWFFDAPCAILINWGEKTES